MEGYSSLMHQKVHIISIFDIKLGKSLYRPSYLWIRSTVIVNWTYLITNYCRELLNNDNSFIEPNILKGPVQCHWNTFNTVPSLTPWKWFLYVSYWFPVLFSCQHQLGIPWTDIWQTDYDIWLWWPSLPMVRFPKWNSDLQRPMRSIPNCYCLYEWQLPPSCDLEKSRQPSSAGTKPNPHCTRSEFLRLASGLEYGHYEEFRYAGNPFWGRGGIFFF